MKNDLQITGNVEKYKIRFGLLAETSFVTLFLLKGLNLWMRADGPPAVFAKCLPYFYQNENYIVLKICYMATYSYVAKLR